MVRLAFSVTIYRVRCGRNVTVGSEVLHGRIARIGKVALDRTDFELMGWHDARLYAIAFSRSVVRIRSGYRTPYGFVDEISLPGPTWQAASTNTPHRNTSKREQSSLWHAQIGSI